MMTIIALPSGKITSEKAERAQMKQILKMLRPLTESKESYLLFLYSAISEEEEVSMS